VGPDGLNVDGGSMAPKNMPQQIQLAQQMQNDFRNDPHVDQRWLIGKVLELYGISSPEARWCPTSSR
jgi:hypothetical protein